MDVELNNEKKPLLEKKPTMKWSQPLRNLN